MELHFSAALLERESIRKADDFTVYDVRAVDGDEVLLEMGDDSIMDFIFGGEDTPSTRNALYLDSPDISSSFLKSCLSHFVDYEGPIDRIITHVEFAHCHCQQMPTLRHITLEYEHEIQVEWSAKNKRTGRVMEARASRNGDDDAFCHLTLNVPPSY